jgi:hypothetical protein
MTWAERKIYHSSFLYGGVKEQEAPKLLKEAANTPPFCIKFTAVI